MASARYSVEWTDQAEGDVLNIVLHFDSRLNAERTIARFGGKASSLAQFPGRGRIVPELERIGVMTIQEVIIAPWRMLYEVRGHVVYVVAVFDGRRDLADVLFERFVRP